ncbi:DUF3343 domain-containing protein [Alkaliphilus metalliredigens]|nr:DUF3343 domain-containing protein [Alkaliphilus metalliredigens]
MGTFYCVLTFHTTHHALNAEVILKKKSIPVKLMPVPRQVSSSCGIAAEIPCSMKEELLGICHRYGVEIDDFHSIEKENKCGLLDKMLGIIK